MDKISKNRVEPAYQFQGVVDSACNSTGLPTQSLMQIVKPWEGDWTPSLARAKNNVTIDSGCRASSIKIKKYRKYIFLC